jgi:hypothetical protein
MKHVSATRQAGKVAASQSIAQAHENQDIDPAVEAWRFRPGGISIGVDECSEN